MPARREMQELSSAPFRLPLLCLLWSTPLRHLSATRDRSGVVVFGFNARMPPPPGLASLCRQASWDEAQVQLVETGAPPFDTGLQPPPPLEAPALRDGQADRAQQVAQLKAYLAELHARGASEAALVQLPAGFADLVERTAWAARSERAAERGATAAACRGNARACGAVCFALRPPLRQPSKCTVVLLHTPCAAGWVVSGEVGAAAPPTAAAERPAGGGMVDPKLSAALAKVLQLDGALAVADHRAAAVEAEVRKLEQRDEAGEQQDSGGASEGMASAMARERRRLQRRDRLEQALQGDGEAGSRSRTSHSSGGAAAGEQADAAAGTALTQQQEALVEALLVRSDGEGEAAAPDPFAAVAAQLAVIDAQLAALSTPAGAEGSAAAAGGAFAAAGAALQGGAAASGDGDAEEADEEELDLEAAAASYHRCE